MVGSGFPDDEFLRYIRRMQEQLNAVMPPEAVRRLQQQIESALPPTFGIAHQESFRRLQEQLNAALPPESVRRMQEHISALVPPGSFQQVAEQLARSLPHVRFDDVSISPYTTADLRHVAADAHGLDVDLSAAADELGDEIAHADATGEQPLGAWLLSQADVTKLKLLVLALQVLDAASKLIVERAMGEDIPDSLQAVTTTCFAVASFLTLIVENQLKRQEDDE